MRDLRTTATNRLLRRGRWSAAGRFRGVIAPMLSKSSLFRPVARDYGKQKQAFSLVNNVQTYKAGDVAIRISPTIRLTCVSGNTDHTDFRFDSTRIFQTLNVDRSQRAEFSSTARTKVTELLSSLFSTFGQSVREITRSSSSSFSTFGQMVFPAKALTKEWSRSEFLLRAFGPLREKTFLTTRTANNFTRVSELQLFTNHLAKSNTTNREQRHDNWLLLPSNSAKTADEPRAATNTFTTLTLNFAAPNASETELVQQRIAHFVSLPALTYAKHQKEMSHDIVQALRELRTVEHEPQRVAAPVLPTIEQLTSQVKTQLERELRIERERRGR